MRNELSFTPLAQIQTELLAVFATDTQTAKGPDVKPQPVLLTSDEKVREAATSILTSGEYKAGPNETVLLHAPSGLLAKRLLIVGLGKKDKATADQEAKKFADKMMETLKAQDDLRKLELKVLHLDAMTKPLIANSGRILASMK